jgi:hypothetical protein
VVRPTEKSEHHPVVACVVLNSVRRFEPQTDAMEMHDGFNSVRAASESRLP